MQAAFNRAKWMLVRVFLLMYSLSSRLPVVSDSVRKVVFLCYANSNFVTKLVRSRQLGIGLAFLRDYGHQLRLGS